MEERLCVDRLLGRLRFTCAHELGHWVLHQKLYSGTGDVAAYEGKTSLDESHGLVEWQADALATALLMPLPQNSKEVFTVCVQAGAMSSWLRKWLRSSKSPSRPCVFGWKHAISYKFGTASPLLREGRSRTNVHRLYYMHFVRSLANMGGGEWHEKRKDSTVQKM